jgi:HSP20 family protein
MASLIKWEPMGEVLTLRDVMDSLFQDSFVGRRSLRPLYDAPALDVMETSENVVVKASVPGVKPEDLDVTISDDVLTIKGESKVEEKVEDGNYIRQERRYGAFQRSVELPGPLVADKAEAKYQDGVLTLTVPKAEEAKPKSIKIEANK